MRGFPFLVIALAMASPARAADWYTGALPQKPSDDWVVAVSTSADFTSQGSRFADVAVTASPGGSLLESGPRVRVDALGGVYSYRSNETGAEVRGSQESGAVLVGYEYVAHDVSVAGYLGADVRHNSLAPADPENSVVGTTVGVKGSVEFYTRPTRATILTGYASYETNESAYFARLRYGFLVTPSIYAGPEFTVLGDAFFNQERIGFYVGGLNLGPVQVALSGGYLYDRVRKGGAYGSLDAHLAF